MIKLSVHETKWCSLLARTRAVILYFDLNIKVTGTFEKRPPDKKESNNGYEHVGVQKGANFTIVCTILLIGLNSKS